MARTAGTLLVLLAIASIALGNPLCCLVGTGCCGAEAAAKAPAEKQDCCSHDHGRKPEKPAPNHGQKKVCTCKHDVAASAAEHAPLVAVLDIPAAALPGGAIAPVTVTACHASPASKAPRSHPLLL